MNEIAATNSAERVAVSENTLDWFKAEVEELDANGLWVDLWIENLETAVETPKATNRRQELLKASGNSAGARGRSASEVGVVLGRSPAVEMAISKRMFRYGVRIGYVKAAKGGDTRAETSNRSPTKCCVANRQPK